MVLLPRVASVSDGHRQRLGQERAYWWEEQVHSSACCCSPAALRLPVGELATGEKGAGLRVHTQDDERVGPQGQRGIPADGERVGCWMEGWVAEGIVVGRRDEVVMAMAGRQ